MSKVPCVIFVTGLSGSGKTLTLKCLEDLGCYVVDNLPIPLIPQLLEFWQKPLSDYLSQEKSIDPRNEPFTILSKGQNTPDLCDVGAKPLKAEAFKDWNTDLDSKNFCSSTDQSDLVKDSLLGCQASQESFLGSNPYPLLAIGIDVRSPGFCTQRLLDIQKSFSPRVGSIGILFLDAQTATLRQRYQETRRSHPLGQDDLMSSIEKEREILRPLYDGAGLRMDTSLLSPPELRSYIQKNLFSNRSFPLHIGVLSFGFRNGVPYQVDQVLDMRFLKNPYYQKGLRPMSGQEKDVQDYVYQQEAFQKFLVYFWGLWDLCIQALKEEGRCGNILAFGCTGGKHRSVFTAEYIARQLKHKGFQVSLYHRDLKS
jgi:RNase adapter protein RapZ